MSTESYPPSGLSASVQKLPEWIQKGCGDKEYICEEKGATFSADSPPADCPDLSKHNSFFSESMNADIWNKLKDKKPSLVSLWLTASKLVSTILVISIYKT